ncbi:hypothetical protein H0H93_013740 [Arthromyces matolae]|nr:hypothetical protein H0H93_013740 [Arthromyces matolae]
MALPMNKKGKTLPFATLTMTLPKFGACYRLTILLQRLNKKSLSFILALAKIPAIPTDNLNRLVNTVLARGIDTQGVFAAYHRQFLLIASWLVTHGKISNNERNRLFQNGLPGPLWNMIQQRLYTMKPSHPRDLPYDMEDVEAAAKYVLWNTNTASPPIAINIIGSMGTRALPEIAMPTMPGPSYGATISVPVAKVEPKAEEIESRLDKKFTTADTPTIFPGLESARSIAEILPTFFDFSAKSTRDATGHVICM